MKKVILLAYLILITISSGYSQISQNYLLGKWVCYKKTMADGNVNDAFGMPFPPRTDTLEFWEDGTLKVYDKQVETSEYKFDNSYLLLGNRKYLLKLLDSDMFCIETQSNLPASWEFRYYFVRLSKANIIPEPVIINEPVYTDDYWNGKWVKYKEGNSSGDTLLPDGTMFSLKIDTLNFYSPDKIKVIDTLGSHYEYIYMLVPPLIGWGKNSHSYGIIDKDHFFLDDFNPNYPEPVVRRHYYKRIL